MTIKKNNNKIKYKNLRAIQLSGPGEKHDVPKFIPEQQAGGTNAPWPRGTHYTSQLFPSTWKGRRRSIQTNQHANDQRKVFFFFFFLRGSYCVMIAFTYFTETKYTYADGLPKDLTFPPGRYINFSFLLQLLREPEATCSSFTRQNETHCLLFN